MEAAERESRVTPLYLRWFNPALRTTPRDGEELTSVSGDLRNTPEPQSRWRGSAYLHGAIWAAWGTFGLFPLATPLSQLPCARGKTKTTNGTLAGVDRGDVAVDGPGNWMLGLGFSGWLGLGYPRTVDYPPITDTEGPGKDTGIIAQGTPQTRGEIGAPIQSSISWQRGMGLGSWL